MGLVTLVILHVLHGALALWLGLASSTPPRWDYGEHKEIGDQAFNRFVDWLAETQFDNREGALHFLEESMGVAYDAEEKAFVYADLSFRTNRITYGALNGLSADHESDPLSLEEGLRYHASVIHQIVNLHNQHIAQNHVAAPDRALARLDFRYALLAALDLSHFHNYGKPFSRQIEAFDGQQVLDALLPVNMDEVFHQLSKTNSINKYITLHVTAITLAEKAGQLLKKDREAAYRYLYYAFLFNAFADHFLEDNFAAGHLVVNRSILSAITNNKALHDFYGDNGLNVVNLNGELWTQYGDGQFNRRLSDWRSASDYPEIIFPKYSAASLRVIQAVTYSLQEVWEGFDRAAKHPNHVALRERVPQSETALTAFFLETFQALSLIPVPFNTDLDDYDVPGDDQDALTQSSQLLPHRNFVRSRVANSMLIGIGTLLNGDSQLESLEFRLHFGTSLYKYNYNRRQTKAGVVDWWLGPTFTFAQVGSPAFSNKDAASIFKAGLAGHMDWWVSDNRFMGFYSYLEGGTEFEGGKPRFLFSPSIGMQLGPLLGLRFYEMPAWLRLPLQFFLPLKGRIGVDLVAHQSPTYYFQLELDVLF